MGALLGSKSSLHGTNHLCVPHPQAKTLPVQTIDLPDLACYGACGTLRRCPYIGTCRRQVRQLETLGGLRGTQSPSHPCALTGSLPGNAPGGLSCIAGRRCAVPTGTHCGKLQGLCVRRRQHGHSHCSLVGTLNRQGRIHWPWRWGSARQVSCVRHAAHMRQGRRRGLSSRCVAGLERGSRLVWQQRLQAFRQARVQTAAAPDHFSGTAGTAPTPVGGTRPALCAARGGCPSE